MEEILQDHVATLHVSSYPRLFNNDYTKMTKAELIILYMSKTSASDIGDPLLAADRHDVAGNKHSNIIRVRPGSHCSPRYDAENETNKSPRKAITFPAYYLSAQWLLLASDRLPWCRITVI
ncbi:hypothetical protein HPB48_024433 [Haemaphysalis longicornis]|uniref:Uncharacterized protein n=1 Tax=Haemaphysalis longicornis TaxID=44386 RepID=A0A9J6H8M9_HAELO|nr:hypothetical protein HPB48_024433 [Haemaphysalis longicornis]